MNDPKATQWLTKTGGLARRLEQARGTRSGLSLAEQLGWSSSKITRIEQGTQIPKPEDIRNWARACELDDAETQDLLRLLEEFQAMRSVMRQRGRRGTEPVSVDASGLVETATLIRTYSTWAVPPILQLEEYAVAVLNEQDRLNPGAMPDPVDALGARMRRQDLLRDKTRRFEIVLDESVLYRRHGGAEVLHHQLEYLLRLTRLKLGIVPFTAEQPVPAVQSIALYDEHAFLETVGGDQQAGPDELALCTRLLDQLWEVAVEGSAARDLISKPMAALDG